MIFSFFVGGFGAAAKRSVSRQGLPRTRKGIGVTITPIPFCAKPKDLELS
jgi:hypothetical protein